MYKIGICDDNELFCWEIERFILDYCDKIHLDIETIIFSCGEELLEHWNAGLSLDLLFLDIELQTTNGIFIGNEIRRSLEYESTQIVFVSIRKDYAMQLFKIRPLDFLIKPVSYQDVSKVIDTFCSLFVNLIPYYEYQNNKRVYRVDQRSIICLQSCGKVITIYTTGKEYHYYGKLSDCMKQLNSNIFINVHKSYIININYVTEYKTNELILANTSRIPISQARRQFVKEFLLKKQIENR
ncbi:MAG: LytTR family DNA-binding domain-containing protein [Lachnospiraceae bacterium]|nr:LytTR family DNA-binding domain-containing protein [Lachnospiraceae bacterium]